MAVLAAVGLTAWPSATHPGAPRRGVAAVLVWIVLP